MSASLWAKNVSHGRRSVRAQVWPAAGACTGIPLSTDSPKPAELYFEAETAHWVGARCCNHPLPFAADGLLVPPLSSCVRPGSDRDASRGRRRLAEPGGHREPARIDRRIQRAERKGLAIMESGAGPETSGEHLRWPKGYGVYDPPGFANLPPFPGAPFWRGATRVPDRLLAPWIS